MISLLNDELRNRVPYIDKELGTFKNILGTYLSKRLETNSPNLIIFRGGPGAGKSYTTKLVLDEEVNKTRHYLMNQVSNDSLISDCFDAWLEKRDISADDLSEDLYYEHLITMIEIENFTPLVHLKEYIKNSIVKYHFIQGRISGLSLFEAFKASKNPNTVLVLDDADIFHPQGLELIKSACEDNPLKRSISWSVRGDVESHRFNGMIIVITNEELFPKDRVLKDHFKAIKSRAFLTEIPLTANDMWIKTLEICERMVNEDFKDHPRENKEEFRKFLLEDMEVFRSKGVLEHINCRNLDLDIRFIKMVLNLCLIFGSDWKNSCMEYRLMRDTLKLIS